MPTKKSTVEGEEVVAETPAAGTFFYWLKTPTNKSEKELVKDGLYQFSERVERFDSLAERYGTEYVEMFEGSIPTIPLHKIAERYKFSVLEPDGKTYIPDAQLLATILESFTV